MLPNRISKGKKHFINLNVFLYIDKYEAYKKTNQAKCKVYKDKSCNQDSLMFAHLLLFQLSNNRLIKEFPLKALFEVAG